jgi:hypothetical protein
VGQPEPPTAPGDRSGCSEQAHVPQDGETGRPSPGEAVIGEVNGKMVALFVAKEGPYQGTVTSSKVVTPEDLRLWGICGC